VAESVPIASLSGRAVGVIWPPTRVRLLDLDEATRATYSDRVRKRDGTTGHHYNSNDAISYDDQDEVEVSEK
jgi:hypothetical protein